MIEFCRKHWYYAEFIEGGIFVRFCSHCGAEIMDEAVVCVKCGCSVAQPKPVAVQNAQSDDTMQTVIKVFLILSCVAMGWMIIPLAWCLPMTISICRSMKEGRPISTGMKVCTLLFVNLIAGICLLCDDNI